MDLNNDKLKNALQLALNSWLQDYRSDAWTELRAEERLVLSEYHFDKFIKEIEALSNQVYQ